MAGDKCFLGGDRCLVLGDYRDEGKMWNLPAASGDSVSWGRD